MNATQKKAIVEVVKQMIVSYNRFVTEFNDAVDDTESDYRGIDMKKSKEDILKQITESAARASAYITSATGRMTGELSMMHELCVGCGILIRIKPDGKVSLIE